MSRTIWHDGALTTAAEAPVGSGDAGFLRGDGLFETLLVRYGAAVAIDAHLERLGAGLALLGLSFPESPEALRAAVEAVAGNAPRPFARLRVTVTAGLESRGPTRVVEAWAYQPPSDEERHSGVDVVRSERFRVDSRSGLAGLKSTSYQLNAATLREARSRGAFEAVLGNERGQVVEGTRSNILLRMGGAWVTPAIECGCLPGTVRAVLLRSGEVDQAVVPASKLPRVSEMILTNSLIGALPVRRLDGRDLRVSAAAGRFSAMLHA